jgi:chemotaxis signal transduction protein
VSEESLEQSADALRSAFDRSFAEARTAEAEPPDHLLAIRVGGDPYAIRALDIASVHADRKVVPVPSHVAHLIGLVGLRSVIAPVYDLRTLLGYPGGPPPRWLLMLRTSDPIGLAFDRFDAHLRVDPRDISGDAVLGAHGICPLIRVASLEATIAKLASAESP